MKDKLTEETVSTFSFSNKSLAINEILIPLNFSKYILREGGDSKQSSVNNKAKYNLSKNLY